MTEAESRRRPVAVLIFALAAGLLTFAGWSGSWDIIGSDKFVRRGLTFLDIGLFCSSYSWLKDGVFIYTNMFSASDELPLLQRFLHRFSVAAHSLLYLGGVIYLFRGVLGL